MLPMILDGFAETLRLLIPSMILALVAGVVLAAMRVSPVAPFRAFGSAYVTIFRNTPLVVLFILVVEGFPQLGIRPRLDVVGLDIFGSLAVMALSIYTAAFVCEAVRSGINTVPPGQAEAARSVGMDFGQTLSLVVLPQGLRAVIPPVTSVLIALTKNTSVAAAFGVFEATAQLSAIIEDFPGAVTTAFFGIAVGYMILVFLIAGVSSILERRLAVSR